MSQDAVAEMIALMTCRSPDTMGGAGGGTAKFTQHDVAALMHGLEYEEAELLRVKYGLEKSHGLWSWWFRYVVLLGWSDKSGALSVLVEFTLEECISPGVCRACRGAEKLLVEGGRKLITCPQCGGAGRRDINKAELARRMGVGSRLNHPWNERLEECRAKLRQVEYAGLEKMIANRGRR